MLSQPVFLNLTEFAPAACAGEFPEIVCRARNALIERYKFTPNGPIAVYGLQSEKDKYHLLEGVDRLCEGGLGSLSPSQCLYLHAAYGLYAAFNLCLGAQGIPMAGPYFVFTGAQALWHGLLQAAVDGSKGLYGEGIMLDLYSEHPKILVIPGEYWRPFELARLSTFIERIMAGVSPNFEDRFGFRRLCSNLNNRHLPVQQNQGVDYGPKAIS